ITGTVTDPNGAVVATAKVTATNLDTGEVREATTGDEGSYTFPELRAGRWRVSVEAPGFKTTTVDDYKVAVQATHTVDIKLELGAVTDVVTVTSESAPVLQSDTPVRQTNVTERQVKELPLLVSAESAGRTPLAFIFLDSTVTSGSTSNGQDASNFRVGGGQSLGTEILIDGAATRRTQKGTFFTEVAPGPNAYQEFTISTSNYSAEFGNSSGGVVNFTLKSGGNEFHGEVYNLWHNDALNANSFLNNVQGLPKNRDHQHDFGGNIGGPIYLPNFGEGGPALWSGKNRAFFFFNFEGYRFAQGENVLVSVPTARMRQGDFGELLTDPVVLSLNGGPIRIYDPTMRPFDPNVPGSGRNLIPNNDLRGYISPVTGQSIIDPVGRNIVQFFPQPNRPGVFRNYLAQSSIPNTMNSPVFKLDFVLSDKQRLAFSHAYRNNTRYAGDARGATRFPEPFVQTGVWQQFFKSHFFRVQHDYTLSPTLLNHFNAGFNRYDVANRNFTEGFNTLSLGFPAGSVQNKAFPKIDFPGYGDAADPFNTNVRAYEGIGSTFFSDQLRDNAMQFTDYLTWVRGRHSMKFGADFRSSQFNVHQLLDPGGEINFRANQTANQCCDRNDQGFPIASLLTGATEFSFNSQQQLDPSWRQISHSYFFQDDIKVTQRLTINAGIRYDLPGLRFEARDRFRGFDPNVPNPAAGGRLGAIVGAAGQSGLPAEYKTLTRPDRSNIGPRIGFAFGFDTQTVVRGGVGLYYAPILYGFGGNNTLTEGTVGYNSPRPANINGGADANPDLFLRNYRQMPGVDPNGQFTGQDIDYFDENFRTGRTLQYGLDVQRELPYNFVVSLSYTGHRADRLRSDLGRINAIPLNALRLGNELLNKPLSAIGANERNFAAGVGVTLPANNNAVYTGFNGSVGQSLKPYPQYGYIRNQLESKGRSWYNAGTLKLERRFSRGIQFGASYTFSKLITDASEDLFGGTGSSVGSVLQNPYDPGSLRSVSPTSVPHVFVVNYLLEMPFGKGKRWLSDSRAADFFLGGWQLSGIQRYQSGLPLVVRRTGQDAFSCSGATGFCTDVRLNLTGQPILTDNHDLANGRARIFNQSAFSAPPSFNQGAPALLLQNGTVNQNYVNYYANPLRFFGNSPAVIDQARDIPFMSENISLLKKTRLTETLTLELGAEAFNIFNRHQLARPGNDFQDQGNFGLSSVDAGYLPRVIQIRVRFIY
ncbi:MAG TPA: TonB-dependent receptor, partial [Pyrinomonadaceae bacterium]|nr:TonB-dependent receptor [Pyrinomonadaceae bacterium]